MTGFRSRYLRHRCTDRSCYLELLPCWDDIIDCLPRGIRPTDLDGVVEINGHVLALEEKMPGASMPTGQRRLLQALADGPRSTNVICFRPTQLGATEMEVLQYPRPEGWQRMPRSQFLDRINKWAVNADDPRFEGKHT